MANMVLEKANRLEGILREFLDCHYIDFGVKANDNLTSNDWKSPINFALGFKYALSNKSPEVKEAIDNFFGFLFVDEKSIGDVIRNYKYQGFKSKYEAYKRIDEIISEFEKILKM